MVNKKEAENIIKFFQKRDIERDVKEMKRLKEENKELKEQNKKLINKLLGK